MTYLHIENLYFHNAGPINLTVSKSECIGITGNSGAGKTLFLRAVADIDPSDGKIFLDQSRSQTSVPSCSQAPVLPRSQAPAWEREKYTGPQWRKKVGLLPAESAWWFDTVGKHFNTVDNKQFNTLGFDTNVLNWNVTRLSSGERQRLALLRLLANQPQVLLLDEPTANLDAENIGRVEKLLEDYRLEHHPAMIWVSHDIQQLKRMTTRFFILKDSKLRSEGSEK